MRAQFHKSIGILSSEDFHVLRILIERSRYRVKELHRSLGNRIYAVLTKRCNIGGVREVLDVVIPCASGEDAFPVPG